MSILISVIVPIYNAEKYIERLMRSMLGQLTKETELILVDDGSTDSSAALCDEYARGHSQVRVIHKSNGGSSSARNAGMMAAQGAYISFVDADDYVEGNTYETLMNVIREHRPDCIDFGWKYIGGSGQASDNVNKLPKNTILGAEVIKNVIIPPLLNLYKDDDHFVYDFVWNKVYRRDLIKTHEIMFNEGRRTWEDRLFLLNYLRYCDNYYSLENCFYNYVYVPASKSQRFDIDRLRIIVENYRLYTRWFGSEYDFDTDYANNYWCTAVEKMMIQSFRLSEEKDLVHEAVQKILQEKEVVHWFSKRTPKDAFERKISAMVTSGESGAAALEYEKRISKKKSETLFRKMKNRLKRCVHKTIGR